MSETTQKRIFASMKLLAERLAALGFRSGYETGDVGHYESEGLDRGDLWIGYWEEVYRPVFAGAYFAIPSRLRSDLAIRRLPDFGTDWFLSTIAKLDQKKSAKLPPAQKQPLEFFNGVKQVAARAPRDLAKRIAADRPNPPKKRTAIPEGEVDARGLPGLPIGAGLETAYALFGKPSHTDAFDSRDFPVWPERGLQLSVSKPGYVISAMTIFWDKRAFARATSAAVAKKFRPSDSRVSGGLGKGCSAKAIRAKHGKAPFENRWKEGSRVVQVLNYGALRFELEGDKATLVAIGM